MKRTKNPRPTEPKVFTAPKPCMLVKTTETISLVALEQEFERSKMRCSVTNFSREVPPELLPATVIFDYGSNRFAYYIIGLDDFVEYVYNDNVPGGAL